MACFFKRTLVAVTFPTMAPPSRSGRRGLLVLSLAAVGALQTYSLFFRNGPAGLADTGNTADALTKDFKPKQKEKKKTVKDVLMGVDSALDTTVAKTMMAKKTDREPAKVMAKKTDREPASDGFGTKVMAAATQGAVAAAVAAALSACTEPFVNRLLVKRQTFAQAWQEISVKLCAGFFLTTLPTNMLKFPIFEVINIILTCTSLQGWLRGMVNGFLFCTIMLPVTNYRFRKSMNLPIENIACLYQAYIPTVSRDILYGWARGLAQGLVEAAYLGSSIKALEAAGTAVSFTDRCIIFGIVIFVACIISSPCNEWRGFMLQPPTRKLPFGQYFKPVNYMRSTGIGALIMGISLSMGMRITPFAKSVFASVAENLGSDWIGPKTSFAIGFGIVVVIITLMNKYCRSKVVDTNDNG